MPHLLNKQIKQGRTFKGRNPRHRILSERAEGRQHFCPQTHVAIHEGRHWPWGTCGGKCLPRASRKASWKATAVESFHVTGWKAQPRYFCCQAASWQLSNCFEKLYCFCRWKHSFNELLKCSSFVALIPSVAQIRKKAWGLWFAILNRSFYDSSQRVHQQKYM